MNISTLLGAVSALVVLGVTAQATGSQFTSAQRQAAGMAVDGSSEIYCTATANSFGTVARIAPMGSYRLSDDTFGLRVTGLPPATGSFGLFTCGTVQTNVPFGNGYLCISPFSPGIFRMPVQALSATTMEHTMALNPLDFSRCTAGSTWNFQYWYRNPAAGGSQFNLSDAMSVRFAL